MFENSDKLLEVSIKMVGGDMMRGLMSTGQSISLAGVLSKETVFIELMEKSGKHKYIAKHQIISIEPLEPIHKPALKPTDASRQNDAFSILGLDNNCTLSDAKIAFRSKVKQYHPDSYSGIDLPPEVSAYINEMFRQINNAFIELGSELN